MRLNVGCDSNVASGWINIDRSPNVVLDRRPALKKALRKILEFDCVLLRPDVWAKRKSAQVSEGRS